RLPDGASVDPGRSTRTDPAAVAALDRGRLRSTRTHPRRVRAHGSGGRRAAPQDLVRAGVVRGASPTRRGLRARRSPLPADHAAVVPGDLDLCTYASGKGSSPAVLWPRCAALLGRSHRRRHRRLSLLTALTSRV